MSIDFPDEYLATLWNKIDWKEAEAVLSELQKRLTFAAFDHDDDLIRKLQKRLVRNEKVKALAVRHVCSSTSSAGVDKIKWITPADKMRAVFSLSSKNYHAQPMRMVIINSKSTGKERRTGVPTYYDRAMQTLYNYSLVPVVEAWADKKSFAFRAGKSMHDAGAYIMEALKGRNAPELVVIADVKACYASIQHSWLLSHAPMDRKVLSEFLHCGYVFAGELFPTDELGISLGSNISPTLGNYVLDGLQKHIYKSLNGEAECEDYANGNMIRFADDIFVTVRTEADGEKVLAAITSFLESRGLSLSPEKTGIKNIRKGFTFLSHTYIKRGDIVHVYPSEQAVERFIGELREFILTHRKSQRNLIESLNNRLRGWGNYHRYTDAFDAFRQVDSAVQSFLLEATIAKHPKMPQKKLLKKYWYRMSTGEHVYALPNQKEIQVICLSNMMYVNHRKVLLNKNPFVDIEYFEERNRNAEIRNVTGHFRSIWERQNGRCFYCGRPILPDQERTVVQMDLSRKLSYKNGAYVHRICEPYKLSIKYISDDIDNLSNFELLALIESIAERGEKPAGLRCKGEIGNTWGYIKLKRYFAAQTAASVTLSFSEIERIEEKELPKTARKNRTFWYPRNNCNTIAEAWITEGYVMAKIDLEKEKLRVHRVKDRVSHIQVPSWIEKKIPDDAKFELEKYFEYIKEKYGL